jgi:hypothetical protein
MTMARLVPLERQAFGLSVRAAAKRRQRNPRHGAQARGHPQAIRHLGGPTGDRYVGETFVQDFHEHGVSYRLSVLTKSQIYEALEPRINAGEVELLDVSRLIE